MAGHEPYSLAQFQTFLSDAKTRMQPVHKQWDQQDEVYRTGMVTPQLKATLELPTDQQKAVVNSVLSNVNLLLATILNSDPRWTTDLTQATPEDALQARKALATNRYFWERQHVTDVHRDATKDMVLHGNGFVKTHWVSVGEEFDRDPDEVEAELDRLEAADAKRHEAAIAAGLDSQPRDRDQLREQYVAATTRVVHEEGPVVEYVDPRNIFVPVDARRLEETRWLIQRIVQPADEVANNPLFDDVPVMLDAAQGKQSSRTYRMFLADDDNSEPTATIYEAYDFRTGRLMVFQENAADPLYEGEFDWSHSRVPFQHMRGHNDANDFWAFGEMEVILPTQQMFVDLLSRQASNVRRSGTKWVANAQVYNDDLDAALTSEEDDVVAVVEGLDGPIDDAIKAVDQQPISPDSYQLRDVLRQAIQGQMGIPDLWNGILPDRVPATGVAAIEGVAELRVADKMYQVEKALTGTAQLILLLCQEHLSPERALKISDGRHGWLDVTADDLWGEYRLYVKKSSTRAVNPAVRDHQANELLQQTIPTLSQAGAAPEGLRELARQALHLKGIDDEVAELLFPDQPAGPQGPPEQPAGQAGGGQQALPPEAAQVLQGLAGGGPAPQATQPEAAAAQMGGGIAL